MCSSSQVPTDGLLWTWGDPNPTVRVGGAVPGESDSLATPFGSVPGPDYSTEGKLDTDFPCKKTQSRICMLDWKMQKFQGLYACCRNNWKQTWLADR